MAGLDEIREADAPAEIAALYRDIRETTRLPLVNLIYRHLATITGGLASVWSMAPSCFLNAGWSSGDGSLSLICSRVSTACLCLAVSIMSPNRFSSMDLIRSR